jgi:phosphate transport system permease protein
MSFSNPESRLMLEPEFRANLPVRHRYGRVWQTSFLASTVFGIFVLVLLLLTILNNLMGYAAIENTIDPDSLAVNGVPLEVLDKDTLVGILQANVSSGLFRQIGREQAIEDRSQENIYELILDKVLKARVVDTWNLSDTLFKRAEVLAEAAQKYPKAEVVFKVWLDFGFLTSPQASNPLVAGVRTAILGSAWIILITIVVALPIGVGAAIYLEEYSVDTPRLGWINRLIQTNITNLAGVPSIIYGMLGLALFVRALEPVTSGALFGLTPDPTTANGRTILAAGLTLALLILPLLIINGQEAIRAVPNSLRQASYGLGATKWQTVWHHVLPNAIPGILTGTILAISRAVGETAPLVVVGAATYITFDPSGPFSKFTTLPIQIYQWTSRPQDEFRNLAAAGILVLMALLLTVNAAAIFLRNRFRQTNQ